MEQAIKFVLISQIDVSTYSAILFMTIKIGRIESYCSLSTEIYIYRKTLENYQFYRILSLLCNPGGGKILSLEYFLRDGLSTKLASLISVSLFAFSKLLPVPSYFLTHNLNAK